VGWSAKEPIQISPRGKDIVYDQLQSMEGLGFQWNDRPHKEDRLSELDYRKIQGHCNVPLNTVKTLSWLKWERTKNQYKLQKESHRR
jgi:hypothetical protein